MFDEKTAARLGYYVYALIDPGTGKTFYIGKGFGNRVFDHVNSAASKNPSSILGRKYELIKEIFNAGRQVEHVILRHGLTEDQAFLVEASLIDYLNFFGEDLANEVIGKGSVQFGAMRASQIGQIYNAVPLLKLRHEVVIININRTYDRAAGGADIYNATKESWVISAQRRQKTKYALSEYRGIIIEVFEIIDWYQCDSREGKPDRWGFSGEVAKEDVRDIYLNKSIQHVKKIGAANPIRYNL
ncbi:hypothetical protein OAB79_00610 [Yoonia sp.]|nr:hypothetical protein [Yoonia sp.]